MHGRQCGHFNRQGFNIIAVVIRQARSDDINAEFGLLDFQFIQFTIKQMFGTRTGQRCFPPDERRSRIGLSIHVDDKNLFLFLKGEIESPLNRHGGFAHAALLVCESDDATHTEYPLN